MLSPSETEKLAELMEVPTELIEFMEFLELKDTLL